MPPLAGERWWRQPPKGESPSPTGRLYGFRRQRRYKKWRRRRRTSPVGTVSQPIGKPFNGQAKGLLWLTWRSYAGPPQYFIPPEGGALNLPVRRQPITGRTLGAQGQRPGGAINLHAHQGVSTFGNTASRQFFTKTHGFPDAASFIKNKKIPYPAGIQRSRIGVVSHFRRSEGGQRYGR